MKKDDNQTLNLNLKISKRKDSITSEKYLKYKVDDSESNISEDDIETKMNRLIQIKKAIKSKKVDSESIGYERMNDFSVLNRQFEKINLRSWNC